MRDLIALVPMGSVALLFWFVMRAVLGADRRERAALAELDAREVLHPTRPVPVFDPSLVTGVVVGDVRDVRERPLGAAAGTAAAGAEVAPGPAARALPGA